MRTIVIVTHSVVGFHHWPEAPEVVAYLAAIHRHLFVFRLEVRVEHDNRQVEFHLLKQELALAIRGVGEAHPNGYDFKSSSCEHLARGVMGELGKKDIAVAAVECWEDNECGARVEP